MSALTKKQLEMIEQQNSNVDEIFSAIANILKQKTLDRPVKKKLTRAVSMLNRVSDLLYGIVHEDDEEIPGEDEGDGAETVETAGGLDE